MAMIPNEPGVSRGPARRTLLALWQENTQRGERVLVTDLYEYLYGQGMELHMEPKSASGEIDFISEQVGEERLLIEAKVYHSDVSRLIAGFGQIHAYACSYNQPFGYLVIYNVGNKLLDFEADTHASGIDGFSVTGRTIFVITVDIADRPPASKRGQLSTRTITRAELVKEIP